MHILLGILAVIGVIGTILYRMGGAAQGAREVADAATDVMGAARRAKFRRQATKNPLAQLEDPREA